MNKYKTLKLIGNLTYGFVIAFIVFLALTVAFTNVGVRWKYKAFIVKSGSMFPTIKAGSMVIVSAKENYEKGDIITFYSQGFRKDIRSTVTHRIIDVNTTIERTQYLTKGDANQSPDATPLEKAFVIGEVVFVIPLIGYLVAFTKTQTGFVLLIVIPVILIVYSEFLNIKKVLIPYLKSKKKREADDEHKGGAKDYGEGGEVGKEIDGNKSSVKKFSTRKNKIADNKEKIVSNLTVFIAILATLGFLSVGKTFALESDNARSKGNNVSITTLDMKTSSSTSDFSAGFDNMFRGDSVTRDITIENLGKETFLYRQFYKYSGGDTGVCNSLNLEVTRGGDTVYSGKLKDYELNSSEDGLDPLKTGDALTLDYEVSVPSDADYNISQKTCVFDIYTSVWQTNLTDESQGFWDEEGVGGTIATGDWVPETPTGITILDHEGNDLGCNGVTNNRAITVDWADNTEFDLNHYDYQNKDGGTIAHPTVSKYSGNIRDLDGLYYYRVAAVDDGGNISSFSEWCYVTLDRTISDAKPGDVLINEIMWSGSTESGDDEWIELYNSTGNDLKLKNWKIEGAGDGGSDITIPGGYIIPSHGYFLISNFDSDDPDSALADGVNIGWVTTDVSLDNDGEDLKLVDAFGNEIDSYTGGSWPAGEDGVQKRSMERNDDPDSGWHSCTDDICNDTLYWDSEGDDYGTPGAENLSENDPSETPEVGTPLVESSDVESGDSALVDEPERSSLSPKESENVALGDSGESGDSSPSSLETQSQEETSQENRESPRDGSEISSSVGESGGESIE